jgi:scyllo-inositol 2-dehydrogenase (NADP+)
MTSSTVRPATGDLRVGIIGYGLAGSLFHAPFIATTPGLRVAAIVTANAGRAQQARRDHPGAAVVDRAERLWDATPSLDLVVVASPNASHVPLALAALAAGLHVVVDKPFAHTPASGRQLVQEARARGRLVVPFHNRRWDGDLLTIQRLRAEGALGEVLRFESRFERWRLSPKPRWCEADASAGAEGILFDLGSHLVDQALLLFGPVRTVYAELDQRHPSVRVAEEAFLALTHASGVRSHLHTSMYAAQPGPRFTVSGDRAAYVKHGLDPQEDALREGARPGPGWGEEPADRWGVLGVGDERRAVRTEPGAYQRFYAGMLHAVRDGAPPPVAPEDAIAGLDVLDAALRSSAERRVVTLDAAGG